MYSPRKVLYFQFFNTSIRFRYTRRFFQSWINFTIKKYSTFRGEPVHTYWKMNCCQCVYDIHPNQFTFVGPTTFISLWFLQCTLENESRSPRYQNHYRRKNIVLKHHCHHLQSMIIIVKKVLSRHLKAAYLSLYVWLATTHVLIIFNVCS